MIRGIVIYRPTHDLRVPSTYYTYIDICIRFANTTAATGVVLENAIFDTTYYLLLFPSRLNIYIYTRIYLHKLISRVRARLMGCENHNLFVITFTYHRLNTCPLSLTTRRITVLRRNGTYVLMSH